MEDLRYYGDYARFNTASKKDAATLTGADNIVGDIYDISLRVNEGSTVAWIVNKFGADIGFIDDSHIIRELQLCFARSWTVRALLSFVAYTDAPGSGLYWGEVALICNDPHFDDSFSVFAKQVGSMLSDGTRPDVALGTTGVDSVIREHGQWMTHNRRPLPERVEGTVFLKKRTRLSEKVIEQGRSGNKGCYFISVLFIIVVIALLIFGALHLFQIL